MQPGGSCFLVAVVRQRWPGIGAQASGARHGRPGSGSQVGGQAAGQARRPRGQVGSQGGGRQHWPGGLGCLCNEDRQ